MRSLRRVIADVKGGLRDRSWQGNANLVNRVFICLSGRPWQLKRLFASRGPYGSFPRRPEPGLASRACDLGSCPGPRACLEDCHYLPESSLLAMRGPAFSLCFYLHSCSLCCWSHYKLVEILRSQRREDSCPAGRWPACLGGQGQEGKSCSGCFSLLPAWLCAGGWRPLWPRL